MLHAREDYNRIQDPSGLIPTDEPVFLVRAQDVCAIPTLLAWIHQARHVGASEEIIDAVKQQIDRMADWKITHPVKVPDMPPGAGHIDPSPAPNLLDAAKGLKRIVEEIDGTMNHGTWRDEKGNRLKDTPEWIALYLAISEANHAG